MDIYYKGATIRGWSTRGDDLEYVYVVEEGYGDFLSAMNEAWKNPRVIRVTVEFSHNPIGGTQ